MESDVLSQAIVRLFKTERFYAEVVLQMDRFITKRIETAGVCVKDKIQLHVNPEFFASKTLDEQVAILKHECDHILYDHIGRSKALAPEVYEKKVDDVQSFINEQKHKLINIAADCTINPGNEHIPKDSVFPKMFKFPDGETMEWYVDKLKNNKEAQNLTHFDGHSLWAESEGEKEELKAKIKMAIEKAAKATRGAGRMTAENELLVSQLIKSTRDWKGDLRRFAARSIETSLRSSRKKRNRRYGILYPGSVKEERLHIGVAIDTSGSVSDEALAQFFSEIKNMSKYARITVVEADSEVKNVYEYDPKKTYTIKGRGGTAYQPAFDYFTKETEIDGVIYLGDMDCFDTEELKKPLYPVLWAIIGDQDPPASWGSRTKIEVKS